MKRISYKIMLFVLLFGALASSCITREKCARYYPPKVTRTDSVKITITEHTRDTIFKVTADSSLQKALIECDSLGQAHVMQYLDYVSGSRAKKPIIAIQGNVLTAKCICDSLAIYAALKDREKVIDQKTDTTTTPPAVEVKFIPGWMWFFGITGMVAWALALLFGAGLIIKRKFKIL